MGSAKLSVSASPVTETLVVMRWPRLSMAVTLNDCAPVTTSMGAKNWPVGSSESTCFPFKRISRIEPEASPGFARPERMCWPVGNELPEIGESTSNVGAADCHWTLADCVRPAAKAVIVSRPVSELVNVTVATPDALVKASTVRLAETPAMVKLTRRPRMPFPLASRIVAATTCCVPNGNVIAFGVRARLATSLSGANCMPPK